MSPLHYSPETTILGVSLLVFGYLLRVHKLTFLVAGFEDSDTVSKEDVAVATGNYLLGLGPVTIIFGYAMVRYHSGFGLFGPAFAALALLGVVWLVYRVHTDRRPEFAIPRSIWSETTNE